MIRVYLIAFTFLAVTVMAGCQKDNSTATTKNPSSVGKTDEHDHEHEEGHGDEGPMMELGTATAGGWTVTAERSEAALAPGREAVVECSFSGGSGKVSAVRCWIGTEDGSGSIKALAEAEDTHFHAHVEAPSPIPAGSKLWVEVEDSSGAKNVASFDLKQ
jgi:hypothetical protein